MATSTMAETFTQKIKLWRENFSWKMVETKVAIFMLLAILTLIFSFDLFIHPGKSITFDGFVHMSTMAQFFDAIKDGEIPARWANNFSTYGLPLPLIAQQVTSYLGALFIWITGSVVTSYNMVVALGMFLSLVCMYRWLRFHVRAIPAVMGTILFAFAPYRIMNVYMRGALPEFFATVWIVLLLCAVEYMAKKRIVLGSFLTGISVCLLALTHPMMLVTGGLCVGLYVLFLFGSRKLTLWEVGSLAISAILGVLMASYYLYPLTAELNYFTYGEQVTHLRSGEFLPLTKLLSAEWPYFGTSHPGPPGEAIKLGILEVGILIISLFVVATRQVAYRWKRVTLFWLGVAGLFIFFMTPSSRPLYEHLSIFSNLQYPWRWLSVFVLIPPFLLALLFQVYGSIFLFFSLVFVIGCARIPQLYGKNYMVHPESYFYGSIENLHTANMNTVWMGNPSEYPPRVKQYDVIGGEGKVTQAVVKNSSRWYKIESPTPVHMVDYTFFFPGWLLFIDGAQVPIEFQDPHYRGMITYRVPEGEHTVELRYVFTRTRKLGILVSLLSAGALGGYVLMLQWLPRDKMLSLIYRKK